MAANESLILYGRINEIVAVWNFGFDMKNKQESKKSEWNEMYMRGVE